MYLFIPIVNKGIEYLTKSELKLLLISIYVVFIIWRDSNIPNIDVFTTCRGTSILWFLILYISGGYLGKNNIYFRGIKNFIFCLICLLLFLISSLLCYYLQRYNFSHIKLIFIKKIIIIAKNLCEYKHDSFSKIIQTISISLFLINIKYNQYLGKIISFFGSLTFGVYLIHDNYLIRKNVIKYLFYREPSNLSCFSIIKLIIAKTLIIFGICSIIDYLRYLLFEFLKIRKLCIIIEKKIKILI